MAVTTTATAAAAAPSRPDNPYAKPKPSQPPSYPISSSASNPYSIARSSTAGVSSRDASAVNAASAMPQQSNNNTDTSRNNKLSVGDDYGDGGIDWSAIDMSVGAGGMSRTKATAVGMGNAGSSSTGTHGRKEAGKPAAEGAADKTAAAAAAGTGSASNINQDYSHQEPMAQSQQPPEQSRQTQQSRQLQKNPYSLASGIGRPTTWSNPQQQQQIKAGGIGGAPMSTASTASASSTYVTSAANAGAKAAAAAATNTTTSKPSSASNAMASGRTKDLPPLPPMIAYDPDRVAPVDDGRRAELIRNAQLNAELLNGWKILPHQKSGVLRGLKMRRFILAFDMGLGKTLVGCVWGKAFKSTYPNLKIYCICPVSLKQEWVRTASKIVGLDCDDDGKEESPSPELDMHVCSWQKIPSPRKVPEEAKHYVVVADEAHQMQNITSARTKDALDLMQDKRCLGVLLLTGTPMKNGKPCNIFPLLRAVRHPFGDNQRLFETFFCNGMQKNFRGRPTWDASGSSNLNHLNAHIASHMLFMTKEECLENLPPKTREFRNCPVSSRDELKHSNAMNELAKLYQSLHSDTKDNDSKDRLLGAFNRVRLISSEAKIGATVRLAQSILEKEPAVVIFTNFVAVAKEVHRKLEDSGWNGHVLTGETPPKKRQPMVDDFQAGISAAFVCTFGAGGVGLTLTAAATIILLDRPWTPGDALQAEDRVRRIGQTKPVTSIWMRSFDLDEQIDILIEEKKQTSLAVVDRKSNYDSPSHMAKAAPKISIFQLVNSIINRQSNADALGGLKKAGPE